MPALTQDEFPNNTCWVPCRTHHPICINLVAAWMKGNHLEPERFTRRYVPIHFPHSPLSDLSHSFFLAPQFRGTYRSHSSEKCRNSVKEIVAPSNDRILSRCAPGILPMFMSVISSICVVYGLACGVPWRREKLNSTLGVSIPSCQRWEPLPVLSI